MRLLLWLPPIRTHENQVNARELNRLDIDLEDTSDHAIVAWFKARMQDTRQRLGDEKRFLVEATDLRKKYLTVEAEINQWIGQHQPETIFSETLTDRVAEVNDRVLRFRLFKLAPHYWEARWLLDMGAYLEGDDRNERSPDTLPRKLRRFAELTPCFVSTFYMVPSTFTAWRSHDIPLMSEIDLLIVDESGQASPEVAAASFALAKRALIVGDTDQIEPIWSIPDSIDRANLKVFDLLESGRQYDEFWSTSGLLASSGNVMRVAQRQCRYHQVEKLQRGLYLTEHRRCYDEIVGYCNELVYKGVLEPLRGDPKKPVPWGTMSMIPVFEPSQSFGGSRGNPGEARQIAGWLAAERGRILSYARDVEEKWADKDDTEVLNLAVGIVTPFKKQAELIKQELRRVGISDLTVGTVHSLQGDERLLVLFSSVYGENHKAMGKFYDAGPNMLNVAVSRAKDSFIVFGHPKVFGAEANGLPSAKLRACLTLVSEHSDNRTQETVEELF